MGAEHTSKDRVISFDDSVKVQKEINGHVSAWLRMTGAGANHDHENRMRMTYISESAAPAPMYLLYKDHKVVKPNSVPKTRPVVSDCSGMGSHFPTSYPTF